MRRKQAAQIAALERMLAQTEAERDKALRERDLAYAFIGERKRDTTLVDAARRELESRWDRLRDLAGFGR